MSASDIGPYTDAKWNLVSLQLSINIFIAEAMTTAIIHSHISQSQFCLNAYY